MERTKGLFQWSVPTKKLFCFLCWLLVGISRSNIILDIVPLFFLSLFQFRVVFSYLLFRQENGTAKWLGQVFQPCTVY